MLFSGYIGKNTFEDGERGAWTGVTVATAPAGHPLGRTKALKQEGRDAYYLAPTTDGFFQTSAHDKTFRVTGYVYNASNKSANAGLNSKNPTNGNSWPVEMAAPANSGEWVRYDNTFTVADGDGTRLRPFLQIAGFQGDGTEFEAYWTDMTLIEVSDAVVPDVANPDGTVGTVTIETAATTQASINGGLSAQYTVKIDNAGFVAGYGLASTSNQAGGSTTEFKVRADSFQIQSTGSTAEAPFTVITTPFTKNGEPVGTGVYIADAFIAEGTITNAKIGNAAIDDAKIISLNANKITAGTIDVSKVNVQGTGGISVTSASNGSRLEIRNDHIKIYNGLQLRVQIGNLDA